MVRKTEQAYAYAAGSPTYFTDPSGKCIGPFIVLCLAVGVDAAVTAVGTAAALVGTATVAVFAAFGLDTLINSGSNGSYTASQSYVAPQPITGGVTGSGDSIQIEIGASTTTGSNTVQMQNLVDISSLNTAAQTCPATMEFARKGKTGVKDSEILRDAEVQAKEEGKTIEAILDEWYQDARKAKDFVEADKIKATQKGLKQRRSSQDRNR